MLGTGQGSVLRIGVLGPGVSSPMHRTRSHDYGILLDAELATVAGRELGESWGAGG